MTASQGGSDDGDSGGFIPPKSSADAASISEAELQKSRSASAKGDLARAYRHAGKALQSATAYPDDHDCARLAESARGELRNLEAQGLSAEQLKKKGNLGGKTIIEVQ